MRLTLGASGSTFSGRSMRWPSSSRRTGPSRLASMDGSEKRVCGGGSEGTCSAFRRAKIEVNLKMRLNPRAAISASTLSPSSNVTRLRMESSTANFSRKGA